MIKQFKLILLIITITFSYQISQAYAAVEVPPVTSLPPNLTCAESGINTAIGCIPIGNNQSLTVFILRWVLGIGGGIVIFLLCYGGFLVITSSGNPDKIQAGKEIIISSISGIFFLIFSVFILRFFGVNVFALPGFV